MSNLFRDCSPVGEKDMVGVLQRKTAGMLKLAGEMGKLEREPVVDADVKGRLRCYTASYPPLLP